jgi:signal transduction histidine kinase
MRQRISLLVLLTTSAVVVSFVVPLCLLVRTLAEDRAMAAVDQQAGNVAALVAGQVDEPTLAEVVDDLNAEGSTQVSVFTADGRVIGSGVVGVDDAEVRRAQDGEAITTVDDEGGRVLLPIVTADRTTVVRASATPDVLREGVRQAWAGIIGLGVLLMAAAAVIAAQLGRRISEPLLDVAAVAHRLREGDLTARAEVAGTAETEELAAALNGLADRTGELLVAERAAVADLSHRLRTPVTALRLDAEAVSEPELAERLGEHIGVLQRSIDAIVREARRPVRRDLRETCDAADVVRERVRFWQALAEDQQRAVDVSVPDRVMTVPLAAEDLADLVDVLVDNVFAHTPEGTPFSVILSGAGDVARLEVSDEGPGPHRGVPGRRQGTTGLGLDIVRRTARDAGGSLTLGRRTPRGTRVELTLPLQR